MTAILVDLSVNIKITKTADPFIHSTYTVNAWKHQRSLTTIQINGNVQTHRVLMLLAELHPLLEHIQHGEAVMEGLGDVHGGVGVDGAVDQV